MFQNPNLRSVMNGTKKVTNAMTTKDTPSTQVPIQVVESRSKAQISRFEAL